MVEKSKRKKKTPPVLITYTPVCEERPATIRTGRSCHYYWAAEDEGTKKPTKPRPLASGLSKAAKHLARTQRPAIENLATSPRRERALTRGRRLRTLTERDKPHRQGDGQRLSSKASSNAGHTCVRGISTVTTLLLV